MVLMVCRKLMKKNPPTAVLCSNDVVALGAMEGIQRLGRQPSVDFGIVGFNNIPLGEGSWRQPSEYLA